MISISFALWGKDTIHLEHVILSNHDNVIILRKLVGTTRIIVPVDVEVSLSVNSLYGDLTFFDQPKRALRNEQFHKKQRLSQESQECEDSFDNHGWRC